MAETPTHVIEPIEGNHQSGPGQVWSEKKFRTLIEHSSDIVSLIDAQGTILYKSPSIRPILGFEPDELTGRNAFETAHPDDRERLKVLFAELLQEPDKTVTCEFRHLHKDGSYRWVEGIASNMLTEPTVQAVVFNFRDISERKRIESLLEQNLKELQGAKDDLDEQNRALMASQRELEQERHRYEELFNFAPDGYVLTDPNGHIEKTNLAACRMLQQSRYFLRHLPLAQFFDCEDRQKLRELLAGFQQGPAKESKSIEPVLLRRGMAEPMPCSLTVNAVTDPEGERVTGLRWLLRDITKRRQAELALQEREGHLHVLTETMPAVPWSATADGKIDYFSEKWMQWTGLRREEALGDGWKRAIPAEDVPRMEAAVSHSISTGEPFDIEHRLRMADGSVRWCRSRGLPQRDESGRIVRWHGITDDIHDLKMAEEEVRQAKEWLARSNQELERTVAERTAELRDTIAELEHMSYSIVHDMRAPLRAMVGYGEILRKESTGCLSAKGQKLLDRIMDSAMRMDLLITDALNYSRAVRTELPLQPVDVAGLLRSLLASYPGLEASKAEIRIEGEFPQVMANEAGLTQCFSNLLSNAVKFVEPGKVPRIRIWAERRAASVRVWVEDNGIGIPADGQERIFDMFQRMRGNEYEGTGIGLALVRKVAERMGGCVGVESEEGKGSRFWIELQAADTGQQAAAA